MAEAPPVPVEIGRTTTASSEPCLRDSPTRLSANSPGGRARTSHAPAGRAHDPARRRAAPRHAAVAAGQHAGGRHPHERRGDAAAGRGGRRGGVRQVRVLPLPVFRYRRLRIQWGQGRGGLGYRFTVQYPYYCQDNSKILLFNYKVVLKLIARLRTKV